jgi:hypothetical protein
MYINEFKNIHIYIKLLMYYSTKFSIPFLNKFY